ncbi:DNA-binding NarL/FixJ family response regulator/tRNA A-37 threonylcarbamoyl transferase component Bud32 [Methylohalomonas lacus]|uniref:DNA-binding NarL/FixJ family response regulator/tRNA A-37 threonylcarbamoyl transferase component Bud32 n=1 Tax=Methylohalomonas lacus TaxID=398773 RepID=A0AAE3HJT1_9GAMM|nr:protein kinase [Methylohalomonas lacus]MCS3902553.1 DNA-binding NarL/FixJ family response regulator/tRNA A-37 threonylcarbamoyl transferase component Bud32 [Methylohalomonas lacus]
MNVLIIDDSSDFVSLLRLYLGKADGDYNVIDYDFPRNGRPADDYDWTSYDVVLLDYKLSATEDGLEWLKSFGKRAGFPPTIILTAEGDEYVAARAIKLGAADYINKKDVSPKRLSQLIHDALNVNAERTAEQQAQLAQDERIVDQLRKGDTLTPRKSTSDYKLVRLIGKGAMSHVYLAERASDSLSLVLKVLDIQDIEHHLLRRFIQEAELIANISSPFIVKVHEHGVTQKYGYIAMEFFSRGDLKQRLEHGIHEEVAVSYMTHVAYGLDVIHRAGIIHRDLKPANIMFRGDDSLAIADFGISKRLNSRNELTTIGKVLGTPHYMSPEQGQGYEIDTRSDIYSAGVLFYELLTSRKPFQADSPASLIYQHVHAPIPQLDASLQQYQPILERCLAKKPEDRYQQAGDLIRALEAFDV